MSIDSGMMNIVSDSDVAAKGGRHPVPRPFPADFDGWRAVILASVVGWVTGAGEEWGSVVRHKFCVCRNFAARPGPEAA